eukprot:5808431-Prymnesium_polylepis.1
MWSRRSSTIAMKIVSRTCSLSISCSRSSFRSRAPSARARSHSRGRDASIPPSIGGCAISTCA